MILSSALYRGQVAHARLRPRRHRLSYRVFSMLVDLGELDALDGLSRWFGVNRPALLSFAEADHGDGRKRGLREWVDEQLLAAGIAPEGLSVRLLCYPRMFGYVFNPLTVYFCADAGGGIRAVLYEVCNTFGEKRIYVIGAGDGSASISQSCDKELYVSPFVPMECRYDFHIEPPGEKVLLRILESDAQGIFLVASFAGRRQEVSGGAFAGALLAYPLMTLKVVGAIHWEALKLYLKGVPVFGHRKAEERVSTSVVRGHR